MLFSKGDKELGIAIGGKIGESVGRAIDINKFSLFQRETAAFRQKGFCGLKDIARAVAEFFVEKINGPFHVFAALRGEGIGACLFRFKADKAGVIVSVLAGDQHDFAFFGRRGCIAAGGEKKRRANKKQNKTK